MVLLDKREILLGKEKARASGSEQTEGREDKIQTKFPWRIHADPKAERQAKMVFISPVAIDSVTGRRAGSNCACVIGGTAVVCATTGCSGRSQGASLLVELDLFRAL